MRTPVPPESKPQKVPAPGSVLLGDCVEQMRRFPENHFDAVVCDPPYGLEFMGKEWDKLGVEDAWRGGGGFSKPGIGDRPTKWAAFGRGDSANATCETCGGRMRGIKKCECEIPDWRVKGKFLDPQDAVRARSIAMQTWHTTWVCEALRVLKPGGHLLAFGGTRTHHRLMVALEDAGFEIRDCLMWLYGSGFPKSLDISKAIDKSAGATREIVGRRTQPDIRGDSFQNRARHGVEGNVEILDTLPATAAATKWSGWGTALKPAWEPIILARKPLSESTVAANVLAHGTGGINIDEGRIGTEEKLERVLGKTTESPSGWKSVNRAAVAGKNGGRWPANVILDEESAALLDEQSGVQKSGVAVGGKGRAASIFGSKMQKHGEGEDQGYGDVGGASRFFYSAKASRAERGESNQHPTVKPIALMRYLIRLVAPTGALILDPFCGSGTTLLAAAKENVDAIGIDRTPEYVETARARLSRARV